MTLVVAVTNILCRRVTEEEAKDFALNQFGVLNAYLRSIQVTEMLLEKDPNYKDKMNVKMKAMHKAELKRKRLGINIK